MNACLSDTNFCHKLRKITITKSDPNYISYTQSCKTMANKLKLCEIPVPHDQGIRL